jgi:hypothetical protein
VEQDAREGLGECALDEKEQEQNLQERLNARIGEAQRRCTLVADDRRLLHVLKRGLADKAIVTDALDVEETSVGRNADLAQFGKISMVGRCARSRSSGMRPAAFSPRSMAGSPKAWIRST